MKKPFLLIAVISMMISCRDEKPSISDFAWLQGKWVGTTDGTDFFEVWQPASGKLMTGKGIGVSDADTLFSEKIQIEQRADELFYTASVSENAGPVDFKFTGYMDDSIIFENPQHDFPQRVIYYRLPNDKLYVCIDGKDKNAYSKIEFSFQKSK